MALSRAVLVGVPVSLLYMQRGPTHASKEDPRTCLLYRETMYSRVGTRQRGDYMNSSSLRLHQTSLLLTKTTHICCVSGFFSSVCPAADEKSGSFVLSK